ncbi:hypothetical protein ASG36_14625 [Geodermatophilus sp. Leaf369]|uniref:hypothetical protein n=1 Tax=Geodermatophilus sp. Leaf369 TaxID=1736354 RepID=UPI0007002B88|nr:hypothetical protein [Geodermatophilus sp. Leaf369]KQS57823.1 hypothetical protein ASG36_14625 [Geodermatophilus sp. Leaf369]
MTSTQTETTEAPFQVHFVGGGITVPTQVDHEGNASWAECFGYGADFIVTPEILEAARRNSRDGRSIFDLSEEEQVARWGEVKLKRGPWPEGKTRHEPGGIRWITAREEAVYRANNLATEGEQKAARARIAAEFGPVPTKQSSTFIVR